MHRPDRRRRRAGRRRRTAEPSEAFRGTKLPNHARQYRRQGHRERPDCQAHMQSRQFSSGIFHSGKWQLLLSSYNFRLAML